MNRKNYSFLLIMLSMIICTFLSSCAKQPSEKSIEFDYSEKTSAVSNETFLTDTVTNSVTVSSADSQTKPVYSSEASASDNAELHLPEPYFTRTEAHSVSVPESAVNTSFTISSSEISTPETSVSSAVLTSVFSEADENSEFEKTGGKWSVDGDDDSMYILMDGKGGWLQYDENGRETASGTLETENLTSYSMYTSDKKLYSVFTFESADQIQTSDGDSYIRDYKN